MLDTSALIELEPSLEAEVMQKEHGDTLADLRAKFVYAENYRKQFDEIAIRCYKLYIGYREPRDDGRSNLHIPRSYEQVDALRARLVKSFAGQRPFVEFMPRVKPMTSMYDMEDNEKKANVAAALVDLQLDRDKWPIKLYNYITSMLVLPAGIMGIGWRYDLKRVQRKEPVLGFVFDAMGNLQIDWSKVQPMIDSSTGQPVMDPMTGQPLPDPSTIQPIQQVIGMQVVETEEVAYDDNELVNIDYFDFWPDPRGHDIDSCRFVFHREWLTKEQIEGRLKVYERAGSGQIYPPSWEDIASGGSHLEEGKWERLSAVGISAETSDGDFRDGSGLYEVLNYWEDERLCLMINRVAVVYDGANPYWRHSKKPFTASSFEPGINDFYGQSAMQIIEHLQEELNTTHNQRIDSNTLVLNKMWKVRRGADIDDSELVSRPHGTIHVNNMDDVMEFQMSGIPASGYNEEQITKTDMENALAVPSVMRGADSPRQETATEVMTKTTNAGLRFDVKILLFEAMGFKRLAYLMDCNNQQFIDQERLVRLVGEEGADEWQVVKPWEIIGEFDYRPSGSSVDPAANKEVRRQQTMQAYEFASRTQNPYVNDYELTKMFFQSLDLRNPDKLLRTKEEVQQEKMMMQMMQAQQMQAPQGIPMGMPQAGPPMPQLGGMQVMGG